jgi:hypothetical protein
VRSYHGGDSKRVHLGYMARSRELQNLPSATAIPPSTVPSPIPIQNRYQSKERVVTKTLTSILADLELIRWNNFKASSAQKLFYFNFFFFFFAAAIPTTQERDNETLQL